MKSLAAARNSSSIVSMRLVSSAPAIRPRVRFGAIIGGVDDDRVVSCAQIVDELKELTDMSVRFHHPVGINAEAGLALGFLLQVGEDVHPRGVEVAEPRAAGLMLSLSDKDKSFYSVRALSAGRDGICRTC
jgi:hypothetical protein